MEDIEVGGVQDRLKVGRLITLDSLGLIADAYCNYYCFFITFSYFLNSMWWSFLNPANLGLDPLGIGLCALVTFMLPVLLEIRCYFVIFLRGAVILRFLPWLLVLPTVADPPLSHEARATLTCLACAASMNNIAGILAAPETCKATQRAPWALVLGILIMLGIRLAWFSYNPFIDYGWMELKVVGIVVFGIGSAIFLLLEEMKFLPTEDRLAQGAMSVRESAAAEEVTAFYKKRKCWIWIISGWTWFSAFFLTHWLFTSPFAVGKFVGDMQKDDGAPSQVATEIFVILLVALGGVVAPLLTRLGFALEIVGMILLVVGGAVLVEAESVVGGFILAFTLPILWWITLHEVREMAREGAVGRMFVSAGFVVFFFTLSYVGVITCSSVPGLGSLFCGSFSKLVWACILPTVAANIILGVLDIVSQGTGDIVNGRLFAPYKWARMFTASPVLYAAFGATVVISLALLIPAMVVDIVSVTAEIDIKPVNASRLHVMAYNNQNGYDTRGVNNVRCSVKLIQRDQPDIVVIPEGESSHLHTGNSDAWLYMYRTLGMYGSGGVPGVVPTVGLGLLSSRPFEVPTTHTILPKAGSPPEDYFNRPLVTSVVKVDGVDVTIFGLHLEWFGNPTVQVEAVALAAAKLTGPFVITGDFNLEPDGTNENIRVANETGLRNPWEVLYSIVNVTSASVLSCNTKTELLTNVDGRNQRWCEGEYSTVVFPPVSGYQLDYVFFKGLRLSEPARKLVPFVDADVDCSDHRAFTAILELE